MRAALMLGVNEPLVIETLMVSHEWSLVAVETHLLAEQVRALTGGRGADDAFEVVGLSETMVQARDLTRPGGTVVIVGMPRFDATVTFPAYSMFHDEKALLGSNFGSAHVRRDLPRLVALVEAGSLDLAHMVTRTIALDGVNDAFTAMLSGEVIRSVIVPAP